MKTNKVTKLGVSLLSVAALGVVAPALIDTPILGVAVVKAEEQQGQIKIRIRYLDEHSREIAPMYTGVLNPGESVNIYKDIEGHQVVSNFSWMPGYNLTYNIASTFFYGANDGYLEGYLRYKKLDADVKPSETPKPEVKPETKPSETPKPEVKPEPAPKEEEKQEPLKYRITYYDIETRETLGQMTGVINPGQTINIYKKFNGHEIISKDSWMPNYDMTYDIVNEYFYGSADGYNDLHLEYKKVEEPTPEPAPTPTPEPAPTPGKDKDKENPKPEVKPETKPSETPKPEVKPSEKPDAEAEEQKPIKYRISYYDRETGEEIAAEKTGVLNPGETVNIYKDIDGYEIVSKISWMPGYNTTYKIASVYFHGDPDGYRGMYLDYKKLNTDVKPSEETKPDVKPSEQPKQEAKPEPKPLETPKPEVKPETKPSETPKPEVKPETKPLETPKPEVKPETNPSETPKPEVKPETKPSETSKPETKPSETSKPETKPSETSKPEVKPETKPSDTPKPGVKPETKPQTNSNTAPQAPVKPVGQDSNTKADKPVSKTETTALPNTGEQNSILGFAGFLLASLGLAGLTYKGRH